MSTASAHAKRLPRRDIAGVSLESVRAYCETTGDDNPIHHDADAARAHGLRNVVVPGMALAGLFSKALAEDEPRGHIDDLQIRFVSPLYIDAPFFLEGQVVRESADGAEAVWRVRARDASQIFAVGEAQIRRAGGLALPNCET